MPKVLTTQSRVLCGPDTGGHGGSVAIASPAKLTVNGSPVLLKAGIGPAVSNCKTQNSNSSKQCTKVGSITMGEASKLTAGGSAVILDTLAGTTDGGPPPGTLPGTANQEKLTAR